MQILVLVGSLRAGSWTGQVAAAIDGLLPEGVSSSVYPELGALPHYDQDLDGEHVPESVVAFREAVGVATVHDVLEDGVIADADVRRSLELLVASLVASEESEAA